MNSRKVFAVDNAMPNRLGFRFSDNKGRLLENAVFIELKRQGKEVYYSAGKQECDFLVKENHSIVEAIQVTRDLNAVNHTHEVGGLAEAMKTFDIPKGTIIVLDNELITVNLPQGISVTAAHQWLRS